MAGRDKKTRRMTFSDYLFLEPSHTSLITRSAHSLSWLWIGEGRQGDETDSQSKCIVAELAAESLPEV